ncbi:MAG: hypothetical protein ACHQAX_09645 [Gammaproteobacteria bacterium]
MARIRTTKPEFWTSEQVVTCSPMARLLFIGLWNFCDDHGIHSASHVRVKGEVFPADTFTIDEIKRWVNELLSKNLLREYVVDEQGYWIVTGWHKHQRIDRPTYKHPLPQSDLKQLTHESAHTHRSIDDSSTSDQRVLADYSENDRRTLDDTSPPDRNGMDRNGMDIEICEVKTSPADVKKPKSSASTVKPSPDVLEVFSHWQTVMSHPRAKLDNKRHAKIAKSLQDGYTVEELKQAIDGCAATPYNMGANDRGQRFDGIDLIFRDADHIERFLENAKNPPASSKQSTGSTDWTGGAL